MPKTFITERDVDDLKARGITCIEVTDNVVMTDLAVERAFKYGITLKRLEQGPPPQAALSQSVNLVAAFSRDASPDGELVQKVKSLVLARLDGQVDSTLLDAVVTRVIAAMK
jgi:hypothetical protein